MASSSSTADRRRWRTRCWPRCGRSPALRFASSSTRAPIADHIGGNERIAREGVNLESQRVQLRRAGRRRARARERAQSRQRADRSAGARFPIGIWPTETYISRIKSMYLNDEGIQVIHQPAAHSDGDSIVFFRRADVDRHGRHHRSAALSRDRRRGRRQHPGRARRAQRAARAGDSGDAVHLQGRTHLPGARPRPNRRSRRGRRVPGHGHGHSRPHSRT